MPLSTGSSASTRFDVSLMPAGIQRRKLEQYSVHCSSNGQWIATLSRHERDGVSDIPKCRNIHFKFSSEREATKFAKANAPPKLQPASLSCQICALKFTVKTELCHCQNCGVCMCSQCTTRWLPHMLPKTYISQQSTTAKVCSNCDWFNNAFCLLLLNGGSLRDVKTLWESGNINLACCVANIEDEAMFPVHCAVKGGNFQLLFWLVETHECPISEKKGDSSTGRILSLRTSRDRTLIDFALAGKPKVEILRYLIINHNMSLQDTSNSTFSTRSLEALLRVGINNQSVPPLSTPTLLRVESMTEESVDSVNDACTLCFDQPMDCVMTPCGHQLCCFDCGHILEKCPICNAKCSALKIYRQSA